MTSYEIHTLVVRCIVLCTSDYVCCLKNRLKTFYYSISKLGFSGTNYVVLTNFIYHIVIFWMLVKARLNCPCIETDFKLTLAKEVHVRQCFALAFYLQIYKPLWPWLHCMHSFFFVLFLLHNMSYDSLLMFSAFLCTKIAFLD